MMRIIYIIVVSIISISALFSQEGFNNIYELGLRTTVVADIINDNDTLVIIGGGISDTSYLQLFYITKLDTFGNIIDISYKYNEDGVNYYFGEFSSLIKTSDGGYAFVGNASNNTAVFAKYNHNLEEEFISYSTLPNTIHSQYSELLEVQDGYIISGNLQETNFDINSFAQKLDFEGNEVWFKKFGTESECTDISSICKLLNNEIILGMSTYACNPENDVVPRSMIVSINPENGNFLWTDSDTMHIGRIDVLIPTIDSGYIEGKYKQLTEGNIPEIKLRVIKRKKNHELEWVRSYMPIITPHLEFSGIANTGNGNYVAVGYGDWGYTSFVWEFAESNGDSIWRYINPAEQIGFGPPHFSYIRDVIVLSSGSIVCAGDIETIGQTSRQYAWIFKMDRSGCISDDDCAEVVAVKDIYPLLNNSDITPSPNPASDYISFRLTSFDISPYDSYKVTIFDVSGREIYNEEHHFIQGEIEVNTKDFIDGIYYYKILDLGNGTEYSGKFVRG